MWLLWLSLYSEMIHRWLFRTLGDRKLRYLFLQSPNKSERNETSEQKWTSNERMQTKNREKKLPLFVWLILGRASRFLRNAFSWNIGYPKLLLRQFLQDRLGLDPLGCFAWQFSSCHEVPSKPICKIRSLITTISEIVDETKHQQNKKMKTCKC